MVKSLIILMAISAVVAVLSASPYDGECHSINSLAPTEWCLENCQGSEPYCPSDFCSPECAPVGYVQLRWHEYVSSGCHALNSLVTAEWCTTNCNWTPSYCPSDFCSDGCAPHGQQERLTLGEYFDIHPESHYPANLYSDQDDISNDSDSSDNDADSQVGSYNYIYEYVPPTEADYPIEPEQAYNKNADDAAIHSPDLYVFSHIDESDIVGGSSEHYSQGSSTKYVDEKRFEDQCSECGSSSDSESEGDCSCSKYKSENKLIDELVRDEYLNSDSMSDNESDQDSSSSVHHSDQEDAVSTHDYDQYAEHESSHNGDSEIDHHDSEHYSEDISSENEQGEDQCSDCESSSSGEYQSNCRCSGNNLEKSSSAEDYSDEVSSEDYLNGDSASDNKSDHDSSSSEHRSYQQHTTSDHYPEVAPSHYDESAIEKHGLEDTSEESATKYDNAGDVSEQSQPVRENPYYEVDSEPLEGHDSFADDHSSTYSDSDTELPVQVVSEHEGYSIEAPVVYEASFISDSDSVDEDHHDRQQQSEHDAVYNSEPEPVVDKTYDVDDNASNDRNHEIAATYDEPLTDDIAYKNNLVNNAAEPQPLVTDEGQHNVEASTREHGNKN